MDKFIKAIDKMTYCHAVEELKFSAVAKDYFSTNKVALYYYLVIHANEGCTATYIADLVKTSKSAAIIQIKNLENNGFIIKKTDPDDKRIKRLYLSERSKKEDLHFTKGTISVYKKLLKKYTQEELDIFSKILDDYNEILLNKDISFYNFREE